MNLIFFSLILIGFICGAYHQLLYTGDPTNAPMHVMTVDLIQTAGEAVTLGFGLIGTMCFFLGLMKVAERAGLLEIFAKLLRPLLVRLFPDVPANHPAMGAMVMNISANALGLGNAATPFGIKAMQSLQTLNTQKDTATNAMILFLAINTSSVTLLPTGIIALRAAAGSQDPAGIIPTTLFATLCSTAMAILVAKLLQPKSAPVKPTTLDDDSYPMWVCITALAVLITFVPLSVLYGTTIAPWIVPSLTLAILTFGQRRGVALYEEFIEGAKEGIQVAFKIIPYLVAILGAISLLRASGALALLVEYLGYVTTPLGLPAEALPMALMRPLSGSGAYGVVASIINDPQYGPDSFVGYLVSTFQGSTETTFYVLAVYFGAIQIKRFRHALPTALIADLTGIVAATAVVHYLYG